MYDSSCSQTFQSHNSSCHDAMTTVVLQCLIGRPRRPLLNHSCLWPTQLANTVSYGTSTTQNQFLELLKAWGTTGSASIPVDLTWGPAHMGSQPTIRGHNPQYWVIVIECLCHKCMNPCGSGLTDCMIYLTISHFLLVLILKYTSSNFTFTKPHHVQTKENMRKAIGIPSGLY